mgnify:FL=1
MTETVVVQPAFSIVILTLEAGRDVDFGVVWNGSVTDSTPCFVFGRPYGFAFCIMWQSACRDGRVDNKPSQATLRTALGVRMGFQQRICFRVVVVRLGVFVFPLYAYRRSRLKLCQQFKSVRFRQTTDGLRLWLFCPLCIVQKVVWKRFFAFQTTYFWATCLHIYPVHIVEMDKDILITFYINIATQPFF